MLAGCPAIEVSVTADAFKSSTARQPKRAPTQLKAGTNSQSLRNILGNNQLQTYTRIRATTGGAGSMAGGI